MSNKEKKEVNIEWVMARSSRHHGLSYLRNALKEIDNPQKELKIIHVAGTNGKGSTVNYLQNILATNGYTVGTFTSPHLETHLDRIRYQGEFIPEKDFLYYLHENIERIEQYDLGMFEIDLLIALCYFQKVKPDYVILECGVGGRLDNTNIIDSPVLEIITSISYDHTKTLGNRLTQIAYEKAGIIKPRTTIIIGDWLDKRCQKMIQTCALQKQANCLIAHKQEEGHSLIFQHDTYEVTGGLYQTSNATLALCAAWALGIDIHQDNCKKAIKESVWAGRFEKVHDNPNVILDGAHNLEGMEACIASLQEYKKPIAIVFVAMKDKPYLEMAKRYQEISNHLIVSEINYSRSAKVEDYPLEIEKIKDYHKAIKQGLAYAKEGTLLITGSLYFISLARKEFKKTINES